MPGPWISADDVDVSDPDVAREAASTASTILWALSGRRYGGIYTVTERYACRDEPWWGISAASTNVFMYRGGLLNRSWREPSHARLPLRGRPVLSVSEVISDGRTLDPSEYVLVGRAALERPYGTYWQPCGTVVTYTYGSKPPSAGIRAARRLANELAKLWTDAGDCALPERVTSVSRQGVTLTVLDDQNFLNDLRTGIYEIDLFLKAVNPSAALRRPRVLSPDTMRPRPLPVTRVSGGPMTPVPQVTPTPFDATIVPGQPAHWTVDLSRLGSTSIGLGDWDARGQVTSLEGVVLLEFDDSCFTQDDTTLTVDLSAAQTSLLNLRGGETWDLYAANASDDDDATTLIYVLSGNVIPGKTR